MEEVVTIPITRFVLAVLVVVVAGCSNPDDESMGVDSGGNPGHSGFIRYLRELFGVSADSGFDSSDIFQQVRDPSEISGEEGDLQKTKLLNPEFLVEKAKQIKNFAKENGVAPNPLAATDVHQNLRDMGRRFGLSEERIADLEAMAEREQEKLIKGQAVTVSPPGRLPPGRVAAPLSEAVSSMARPGGGVSPGGVPAKVDDSNMNGSSASSKEMQEIVRRREERLREALNNSRHP